MGIIAKSTTKRLMAPQSSPWAGRHQSAPDYLTDEDLLGFAALRAFAHMSPVRAVSDWSTSTGRRSGYDSTESIGAPLRVESGLHKGIALTQGPIDPAGRAVGNWKMRASLDIPGGVTTEVLECRTHDDVMVNRDWYERAHGALLAQLAEQCAFRTTVGLPNFGDWVVPRINGSDSPFMDDYLVPIPESFRDGAQLLLKDSDGIAAVFADLGAVVPAPHGALAAIDLGFGNPSAAYLLSFHQSGTTSWLQLSLPGFGEAPPVTRQRVFRNATATISLARALVMSEHPSTGDALAAALDPFLAAHRHAGRSKLFVPIGDTQSPSLEVELAPGSSLPIGVVITTSQRFAQNRLNEALGPLLARQRTWTRGLKVKSREANRIYTLRAPAVLLQDDKGQPFVRYVHAADERSEVLLARDASAGWFWEANVRALEPPADHLRRYLVLLTGFSTFDQVLSYAPEFFTLLQSWTHVMRSRDPEQTVETLYVHL